jgi:hypothetical protein
MKWYWKIAIGLLSLAALILVLNIGFNLWIKYQLPKIINEKNDSAYAITYKNLEVSFWDGNIKAEDIIIIPKAALKDTVNKSGIYAKVRSVEVRQFKTWSLLFSDKIKAKSITVIQPAVILYKKNEKAVNNSKSIRSDEVAPFGKIISVSDIFLHRGDLKIIYVKNKKAILNVQNIDLQLDGIIITEAVLEEKIPFHFKNYTFSCDSVYYRPSQFYHVRTRKIKTSKTGLYVDHFEMMPEYTRREFITKIATEKDLFTLSAASLAINKMEWGFKTTGDFFFHSNAIGLYDVAANIYRSKLPLDDLTKKYLYNKLLRDLKFDLKVDTLKIRNSLVEYEEEKATERGAGKLSFSKFNLTATNIRSGFKQKRMNNVKIKINCQFMKASPLRVNWTFNVLDKSDGFNINGIIKNFDAEKIVPFTKPYMNVATKGTIDEVRFNFTGNDQSDAGEFAVDYDDLKFAVYKKDNPKKKNKILTFVANLFVKNTTKDKLKNAHVELERIPEKSFYNFLWRSIAEGLKKILI